MRKKHGWKKKLLGAVCVGILTAAVSVGTQAREMNLCVNDQLLWRDVQNVQGFDMLPILDIAGELGFQSHYDGSQIQLYNDWQTFVFKIGDASVYDLAGNWYGLDVVPQVMGGKVMVPAKFFQDVFGMSYVWDNVTDSLFLNSENSYNTLVASAEYQRLKNPVVYTDGSALKLRVDTQSQPGQIVIQWNRIPGIEVHTVGVVEKRDSYYEGDIAPKAKEYYDLRWESSFAIPAHANRIYTIDVIAGSARAEKTVYIPLGNRDGASEISANYPTTKEAALAVQKEITVPVWRLKNGKKVPSTATLQVHYAIADRVYKVFEEIYNGSEQFPIKSLGGYSWRGGRSEHNGGTAIDINSYENYCVYNNGTVVGTHWKPYEDPYSITPYGDVMNAFEKYGFTWGGDAWRNPKDYMHFSYLGT